MCVCGRGHIWVFINQFSPCFVLFFDGVVAARDNACHFKSVPCFVWRPRARYFSDILFGNNEASTGIFFEFFTLQCCLNTDDFMFGQGVLQKLVRRFLKFRWNVQPHIRVLAAVKPCENEKWDVLPAAF